ncbi:MAG: MoaD/ThiS family protein, partial [Vallitaleaceae bacterium]|nr:MoaD/ThiS family protein [Vallitaleaceae bacterium]
QEGDTPYEVIQAIGIAHEEVAILMINGRGVEMNAALANQDVLALFPAVGGG